MNYSKRFFAIFLTAIFIVSTITVISVSAESSLTLKSNSYLKIETTDIGVNIIKNFPEGKILSDLLPHFEDDEKINVTRRDDILYPEDKVTTGVIFSYNGEDAYVIVKGDTTGDGIINSTDYLQIKNNFLGKYSFFVPYIYAADCNEDGIIDSTDYLQIKKYLLKEFDLYPEYTNSDFFESEDSSSQNNSNESISNNYTSEISSENESSDEYSYEIPSEYSSEDFSEEISEASSEEISEENSKDSSEDSSESKDEVTYILNTKSKKIHIPTCSSVKTMSEKNKAEFTGNINELLSDGYAVCGVCKAGQ